MEEGSEEVYEDLMMTMEEINKEKKLTVMTCTIRCEVYLSKGYVLRGNLCVPLSQTA